MKSGTIGHLWRTSSIKQKFFAIGILALLSIGVLGAIEEFANKQQGGILSGIAETVGLKQKSSRTGDSVSESLTPPNGTLQLSKEYVYAGSRMLATENYGVSTVAPTNLALGKSTNQSSTVLGGVSSRAVDGNTSGNWADNSITHTEYTPQPYWEVDLGTNSDITQIKLWNRTDGSTERLANLRVFVSDIPFASTDYNSNQVGMGIYNFPGMIGTPTTFDINRTGRYIRVQLAGTNYLSLVEVQVLGSINSNPPSIQISQAVNDFSTTNNPSGTWSYGYKTPSNAFTQYGNSGTTTGWTGFHQWSPNSGDPWSIVGKNLSGTTQTYAGTVIMPTDLLFLHPGANNEKATVRWTAPTTGSYQLQGRFEGVAGTSSDVNITKNGTSVWANNIDGLGAVAPFNLSVSVNAGDVIDFSVGYGTNGTYYSDSTGFTATITKNP